MAGLTFSKILQENTMIHIFVEAVAHEIVKSDDELYFTKRFRARTHRGVVLYTAQTMVSMPVGQAIVAACRDN